MADKLDLNNINIDTFCDLNGVDNSNRALLNKLYKNKIASYENWHDALSKNFNLHPKKDFIPIADEPIVESIEEISRKPVKK